MTTTFFGTAKTTTEDILAVADVLKGRLEWELKYLKEGDQWEMLTAKGRPAPDWFDDRPELLPAERLYMEAFWALSTTRQLGMSVGPLPWTAIQQYGIANDLDSDSMGLLHGALRAMDEVFLKHLQSEQERKRKRAESSRGRSQQSDQG